MPVLLHSMQQYRRQPVHSFQLADDTVLLPLLPGVRIANLKRRRMNTTSGQPQWIPLSSHRGEKTNSILPLKVKIHHQTVFLFPKMW